MFHSQLKNYPMYLWIPGILIFLASETPSLATSEESSPTQKSPSKVSKKAKSINQIPSDVIVDCLDYLSPKSLNNTLKVNKKFRRNTQYLQEHRIQAKLAHIKELLELKSFISLQGMNRHRDQHASISHQGVSQELWFAVMENNPSFYKEQRHCPQTFKEVQTINYETTWEKVKGKTQKRIRKVIHKIPLCPNLPVDSIQAQINSLSETTEDSVEEFLIALNEVFESQELPHRFRSADESEYKYAATAGYQFQPSRDQADFWKFATYAEISDRDPLDLDTNSPSQGPQPHGVQAKEPNPWGFYRNSLWEWSESPPSQLRKAARRSPFISPFPSSPLSNRMKTSLERMPGLPNLPFLLGGSFEIPLNQVSYVGKRTLSREEQRKPASTSRQGSKWRTIGASRLVLEYPEYYNEALITNTTSPNSTSLDF